MEWLQLDLRLAEPDFCSRLGTEHPTVSIARWVGEGERRSFEIWEFLCGEPIAMRHLKQSLSKFEERGELEILSIQLAYNDVITALVKTHARQDRTTRPDPLWVMEDYSSFVMMPVTYEGSLAHFRIVAMDETEIPRMIGKLEKAGRVEVLSRIPLKTIPVEQYSLFSPREIFQGSPTSRPTPF